MLKPLPPLTTHVQNLSLTLHTPSGATNDKPPYPSPSTLLFVIYKFVSSKSTDQVDPGSIWMISLGQTCSRFTEALTNISAPHTTLNVRRVLFILPSLRGYLGFFCPLADVNDTAKNTGVHVTDPSSFTWTYEGRLHRSYGNSMCSSQETAKLFFTVTAPIHIPPSNAQDSAVTSHTILVCMHVCGCVRA